MDGTAVADTTGSHTGDTPQPSSYSRLSRTISRRTTDLIGIAIVVIGLLSVGGKLSQWWSTDSTEPTPPHVLDPALVPAAAPWGTEGKGLSLDLGTLPFRFQKQSFSGDRQAVGQRLKTDCRTAIESLPLPDQPPSPAEQRLIAAATTQPEALARADHWQIHGATDPLPWVVGLRRRSPAIASDSTGHARSDDPPSASDPQPGDGPDSPTASGGWRVVWWGMALPAGSGRWTLTWFHSPRPQAVTDNPIPELPLPPGGLRILRINDGHRQAWVGFRGNESLDDWVRFYSDWFSQHSWLIAREWTAEPGNRTARYEQHTPHNRILVDVQLTRGNGLSRGLLSITVVPRN